jgi:hypothetical protein
MSVGAIPVGNNRPAMNGAQGYDVYQNKPLGQKKSSVQVAGVNSMSNLGGRTSSLQPGQIVLMQKQKKS